MFHVHRGCFEERRRRARETAWEYFLTPQVGSETSFWVQDEEENPAEHFLPCPFTGERVFGKALQRIITESDIVGRVCEVVVSRNWREAIIHYSDGAQQHISRFIRQIDKPKCKRIAENGGLRTESRIGANALGSIAEFLALNTESEAPN